MTPRGTDNRESQIDLPSTYHVLLRLYPLRVDHIGVSSEIVAKLMLDRRRSFRRQKILDRGGKRSLKNLTSIRLHAEP